MGRYTGKRCRLISMLILTTIFFFIEIIVGYVTNSMALVADSFHMLSDVISLIIAFISVRISPMKWSKNTFGWARAEILGALVNAVFLIALCFSILVEAIKRFFTPEEILRPALILWVGSAGLVVNLIGLFLFKEQGGHGHSHGGRSETHSTVTLTSGQDINENQIVNHTPSPSSDFSPSKNVKKPSSSSQMNMRGVFLHVLTDALGSVIVLISALIIWLTDWSFKLYVDPTLSVLMVCLIIYSTWPLFSESSKILLQTVPTHIEIEELKRKLLLNVPGVLAVHEFHVWQLAGERIIASAHVCCRDVADYMAIAAHIKEFFHNEGIHSTTIQPEFTELWPAAGEKVSSCFLDCPSRDVCLSQTCCGRTPKATGELGRVNYVAVDMPNT